MEQYFTISARKLFHIRRMPNISLKAFDFKVFQNFVDAFPRGALLAHHFGPVADSNQRNVEMFTKLWYNNDIRKAV